MKQMKRPTDDNSQPSCKRLSGNPPGSNIVDADSNEDVTEKNSLRSSIASRLQVLLEAAIAVEDENDERKPNASLLVNENQNISISLQSFIISAKHKITKLIEKNNKDVILNCDGNTDVGASPFQNSTNSTKTLVTETLIDNTSEESERNHLQFSNDEGEKENVFSDNSTDSTSEHKLSTSSGASCDDPLRLQIISKLQSILLKNSRFDDNDFQSNSDKTSHVDFSVENLQNCSFAVVDFLQAASNKYVQLALEETVTKAESSSFLSHIINQHQDVRPLENNLIPNIENPVANKAFEITNGSDNVFCLNKQISGDDVSESTAIIDSTNCPKKNQICDDDILILGEVDNSIKIPESEIFIIDRINIESVCTNQVAREEVIVIRQNVEQESPEIVVSNTRDIQSFTENSELITIDESYCEYIDTVSKSEKLNAVGLNGNSEVLHHETVPEIVIIKEGVRDRVLDVIDLIEEKEDEVEVTVVEDLHQCLKCSKSFRAESLLKFHMQMHMVGSATPPKAEQKMAPGRRLRKKHKKLPAVF